MCPSTLAIYCFIDDFLKASHHLEDIRAEVSDAEIITIALTAMLHFGGNFQKSRPYLAQTWAYQTLAFALSVFAACQWSGGFDSSAFSPFGKRSQRPSLGIALYFGFVSRRLVRQHWHQAVSACQIGSLSRSDEF